MTAEPDQYDPALTVAADRARQWLASVPSRPVPPRSGFAELMAGFADEVPEKPRDPAEVVELLADRMDAGLMDIATGRFFGWVMGGTLPAALAADWLVSAWDQNTGLRAATPGTAAAEEAAAHRLLDLLALPADAAVGFTTGATMANFTGLAAARHRVLTTAGWDVTEDGLFGAPRVRVFVGAERHDSVDAALRYLGLGAPTAVPADAQGRIDVETLAGRLAAAPGPAIVCLQAGNLHSGDFDDFAAAIRVAHDAGAWVHVDGAFGLWAGASPTYKHLVAGYEAADSWATDAHKTLNVPYDCGVSIVADPAPLHAAMGIAGAYLPSDAAGDPLDRVPEMSRRARGVPVWAALESLGRAGVADLVDRLAHAARAVARGIADIPGVQVLNDVVYTQVCFAVGDDDRTAAVLDALRTDGTTWMSGSRWQGRRVVRISVSNWSIDDADIAAAIRAVDRAVTGTG
jgi:glutamate/tyrosine decarboxylase-like PLP-dependent enzyme